MTMMIRVHETPTVRTARRTSSGHPSWLRNRRMMPSIFHRQSLSTLFESMVACTEDPVVQPAEHYSQAGESQSGRAQE